MIGKIIELGKSIYDTNNPRELHRFVVFLGRAILYRSALQEMLKFFSTNNLRRQLLAENAFPVEQMTRAFFYAGSTVEERKNLIIAHYSTLEDKLHPEWFVKLTRKFSAYTIWQSPYEDIDWKAQLFVEPGQRKEGLMSVVMRLGNRHLYQIMFWLAPNKNHELSFWIGAMQGPNMEDAKEIIKNITKRSFRYRTKNLILYMAMAVARNFGCQHIYAVSNDGYYAMNHIRCNRKLKTDFGVFWEETGGHVTNDYRFYEVPLVEQRKSIEEVPTRKRAVYRKRFAFQDDVDVQIMTNMRKLVK